MRMSWRVLMLDRELLVFPLAAIILCALIPFGTYSLGYLDFKSSDFGGGETFVCTSRSNAQTRAVDDNCVRQSAPPADDSPSPEAKFAAAASTLFAVVLVSVFFDAALVAAAMERLRGGDPDVRSGLRAAAARLPQLMVWTLIVVIVKVAVAATRRSRNPLARFSAAVSDIAFNVITFFVVPLIVAEGRSPVTAIPRSEELLRDTWGSQIKANFAFGALRFMAVGVIVLLTPVIVLGNLQVGLALALPLIVLVNTTFTALEGIFKAALYDFATGQPPHGFDEQALRFSFEPPVRRQYRAGRGFRDFL